MPWAIAGSFFAFPPSSESGLLGPPGVPAGVFVPPLSGFGLDSGLSSTCILPGVAGLPTGVLGMED